MSKRTELYNQALNFYREHHADYTKCAEHIGVSYNTAKRIWDEGYKRQELEPIKDVIEREKVLARAHIAKLEHKVNQSEREVEQRLLEEIAGDEQAQREKARTDAIKARAAEGVLVRVARDNAIKLLESTRDQLVNFDKVKDALTKKIRDEIKKMNANEAANLLWRIAISSRAATEAGMKALQMERLLLGQPMEIVGLKNEGDMTAEDALKELRGIAEIVERAEERNARRERKLQLIEGGKSLTG